MSFSNFIYTKNQLSQEGGLTQWILRLGIITATLTISVMILASSIINGFQFEIEKKIFGFWGHVNISNASLTAEYKSKPMTLGDDVIGAIEGLDRVELVDNNGISHFSDGGVDYVQSIALLPGIITAGDRIEGIILKGIDTDFHPSFFNRFLKQGERLTISETTSRDAVISEQTASRLNLSVGDDLDLLFVINNQQFPRKFKVGGIYRTGLEEYDRKFILVDIKRIQQLLKWNDDQVGAIEVFLSDVRDAPLMADYIYYELLQEDQYAESIKEKYPGIFEWLELQGINEWVILGLMLLVCVLNMMTTLLILILEKTNMIGVLKALGAPDWSIRKIFIAIGLRILGQGLLWGNLIGLFLALFQKFTHFIPMNEEDYYLSYVPIQLDPVFLLLINVGSVLIVMIFLLIPSALISRIDPVKALRFS